MSILNPQCLDRRLESQELLTRAVATWERDRILCGCQFDRHFTAATARIKHQRLSPSIQE